MFFFLLLFSYDRLKHNIHHRHARLWHGFDCVDSCAATHNCASAAHPVESWPVSGHNLLCNLNVIFLFIFIHGFYFQLTVCRALRTSRERWLRQCVQRLHSACRWKNYLTPRKSLRRTVVAGARHLRPGCYFVTVMFVLCVWCWLNVLTVEHFFFKGKLSLLLMNCRQSSAAASIRAKSSPLKLSRTSVTTPTRLRSLCLHSPFSFFLFITLVTLISLLFLSFDPPSPRPPPLRLLHWLVVCIARRCGLGFYCLYLTERREKLKFWSIFRRRCSILRPIELSTCSAISLSRTTLVW